MQVLIVVEDTPFRHALTTFLANDDLSAIESIKRTESVSLTDAQDTLDGSTIDLVFVSEHLSGLTSAETCTSILEMPETSLARVVAVTISRTSDVRALYEAGFDAVIGPEPSADEIAAQVIIARRRRVSPVPEIASVSVEEVDDADDVDLEDGGLIAGRNADTAPEIVTTPEDERTIDDVDEVVASPASSIEPEDISRTRACIATMRTLGYYLSHRASPERHAQHTLRALTDLFPGIRAALWLRDRESGNIRFLRSNGLTQGNVTAGTRYLAQLTDDDWLALQQQPQQVTDIYDADGGVGEVAATEGITSAIHFALASPDGPIGVLAINRDRPDPLTADDVASIETIAAMSAVALSATRQMNEAENASVLDTIIDSTDDENGASNADSKVESANAARTLAEARLRAHQTITRVLATERRVQSGFSTVLSALVDDLEFDHATIWLVNGLGHVVLEAVFPEPVNGDDSTGHDIADRVLDTLEPLLEQTTDMSTDDGAESNLVQSHLVGVPIMRGARGIGAISAVSSSHRPLDDGDVRFLSDMAAHIARAIERADLYEQLEQRATTDLVTGLPNRQEFQHLLDQAITDPGTGTTSVLLIGVDAFKDVNELYGHAVADDVLHQIGDILRVRMTSNQMLARYTSDQFAVLLRDVGRDDAVSIAEHLRIGIGIHLFSAAEQVEQLTVSIGAATFPDDAATPQALVQAAEHAMYLAKRAGRNQTFQSNAAFATLAPAHGRINDLLRQSPRETLTLLIRAMDQRLPERAGHSERVTRYALAIARQLGVPDADLPRLKLAAYIHDIGMVSLPDALLRKPSHLSSEERDLLRGVPIAAHGLLSQLDLHESILLAVLHQRENYDGTGYPTGLRGESIPLGARIIAVADALDAMTSVRAHRDPMTLDQALHQVNQLGGSQFDPSVTSAAYCLTDVISEQITVSSAYDAVLFEAGDPETFSEFQQERLGAKGSLTESEANVFVFEERVS